MSVVGCHSSVACGSLSLATYAIGKPSLISAAGRLHFITFIREVMNKKIQ
ncbi:MAG TPA: hypothetical protein PKV75_10095 [Desulfobacterales bacterium]|nr:hypothetical protein [Desulfobacterales bacterium]